MLSGNFTGSTGKSMVSRFKTLISSTGTGVLRLSLNIALLILLGIIIWQLILEVRKAAVTAPTGASPYAAPLVTRSSQDEAAHLASEHLLGTPPPAATALAPISASSAIHVIGILSGDDPEHSWAILDINGSQHTYQAGTALPDGEMLLAVHDDRVVLTRDGVSYSVLSDIHPADTNAVFNTINMDATGELTFGQGYQNTPAAHTSTQETLRSLREELLSKPRPPLPIKPAKAGSLPKPPNGTPMS